MATTKPDLTIGIEKSDFGQGPRRITIRRGIHWVSLGQFVRHPFRAMRVLNEQVRW